MTIRLTRTQKRVLRALKAGQTVWAYSGCCWAWVGDQLIRGSTLDYLAGAELIAEDHDRSVYREASGSDIHYRLTDAGAARI